MKTIFSLFLGFHSINVPSEWGPSHGGVNEIWLGIIGFHSINVPSEWGPIEQRVSIMENFLLVSIQLMSPASGDLVQTGDYFVYEVVFPFN